MRKNLVATTLSVGISIACASFLPDSGRATELLLNGSFETTGTLSNSCGTDCSYSSGAPGAGTDSSTIPDWRINNFSTAGVEAGSGTNPLAEDGVAFAYISSGTIQQTIAATVVVGDTYTL